MRHLIIIVFAIASAVLMRVMKKNRERILIASLFVFTIICGAYSFVHAEGVLKSRRPFNQTFYTPDFIETKEFPDAFLRLYLKDKTVYIKNDYVDYDQIDSGEIDAYWQYVPYHVHNMKRYLDSVKAWSVPCDLYNTVTVPVELRADFEDLGYINDMMRNTMLYTEYDAEFGNYFAYLWYYRDKAASSNFYVNTESLKEDGELVLIWQQKDGENTETEDMYLMGKTYFDDKFSDAVN